MQELLLSPVSENQKEQRRNQNHKDPEQQFFSERFSQPVIQADQIEIIVEKGKKQKQDSVQFLSRGNPVRKRIEIHRKAKEDARQNKRMPESRCGLKHRIPDLLFRYERNEGVPGSQPHFFQDTGVGNNEKDPYQEIHIWITQKEHIDHK